MSDIAEKLEAHGLKGLKAVYRNLRTVRLYESAIAHSEGTLARGGPLVVLTGQHTGRSATDKFIVKDEQTADTVWWDNNRALAPDAFKTLHTDMMAYAKGKELFVQDLWGGADPAHRLSVRVVTEFAWHSMFIRHLLIHPDEEGLANFTPDFTEKRSSLFRS